MTTQPLIDPAPAIACRTWPLELDAEVSPSGPAISARQAAALADLLVRMPGIEGVSAARHCDDRFVLVRLTVAALDLAGAVDRASAALHSCAVAAGMRPLVLVAARCAR